MAGRRANHEGTIRRRERGWEGAVMLGGRRYWVRGRTRAEVVARLRELAGRYQAGQLSPPSRLTLEEWASEWLRQGEGRWRPTTLRAHRLMLAPLMERLGRVRLVRLEPLHIAHALRGLQEGGMGSRAVQMAYASLRACLGGAVKVGLLASNPCSRVARPAHRPREAKDWGLAEMRAFLAAALEDGGPLATMLALMLMTGLRPGEAAALQWGDIDPAAGTLSVRRAIAWEGNSRWHLGPPKSKAGQRAIALPSLALGLLSRLERRGVYVFWAERPPTPQAISQVMGYLCERAGVPRRPAHYLRHAQPPCWPPRGWTSRPCSGGWVMPRRRSPWTSTAMPSRRWTGGRRRWWTGR